MKRIRKVLNLGILIPVVLFVMIMWPGKIWAGDPSGVVFDSDTGQPIDGATVTLERYITETAQWVVAQTGVYVNETNPQTSGVTIPTPGYYQFNVVFPGTYNSRTFRLKIEATDYTYPSIDPDFNVTTTTVITKTGWAIGRTIYVDNTPVTPTLPAPLSKFSLGQYITITVGDAGIEADIALDPDTSSGSSAPDEDDDDKPWYRCGAIGLEALALIFLIRLLSRRKPLRLK